MKKLLLILFVIMSFDLDAQYIVNHAKNVNTKDVDGLYYHLPRNIIRVDFEVEKQQDIKGKYSAFAKEMLNTDNYIKENNTSFRIKSVNVEILTEADPNYVFFISADDKIKENVNINLELTSEGIIQSFGYKNEDYKNTQNVSFTDVVKYEETMTDYYFIPMIDEDEEEETPKLSEKEIAESIIEEIKNIRIACFDLITGYQEVNYGNTMNFMVEELKAQENEYLSMFVGKTTTHTYIKSFYITPEEGKNSYILGKFSSTESFNAKTGENIKINFVNSSIGANVNKLSKDDIENTTYNNKLFYRNPANVTMQVMYGENKITENRVTINQFGNLICVPMNRTKIIFDTNSGQILSIIKE